MGNQQPSPTPSQGGMDAVQRLDVGRSQSLAPQGSVVSGIRYSPIPGETLGLREEAVCLNSHYLRRHACRRL